MADEEMETEAAPRDPSAGLATALIVLTTLMLLMAFVATEKILGERYGEGMFKTTK